MKMDKLFLLICYRAYTLTNFTNIIKSTHVNIRYVPTVLISSQLNGIFK